MANVLKRQLNRGSQVFLQTSMVWGSVLALSLGISAPGMAMPGSPSASDFTLSQTVSSDLPELPEPIAPPPSASDPSALTVLPKAMVHSPSSAYAIPTPSYSQAQIDYFLDIAMGSEYGSATPHIRKWTTDLRIKVHGTPTSQDIASVEMVVDELNALIDPIDLKLLSEALPTDDVTLKTTHAPAPANVNIYFVPYTDFANYVPHYETGNLGYAWIWWQNDAIYDATILISSIGINQTERSHLIREELTQSLGLLRDSYQYEDSIFFQLWTTTTRYSALDEALIRMLYSPTIQPGMTRQAVISALGDGAIATVLD